MEKIVNLNEFQKYKEQNGYIVITSPYQTRVHKSSCSYINAKNFLLKLNSKTKKGDYFWIPKLENIENTFEKISPCTYCNPFGKKLLFH